MILATLSFLVGGMMLLACAVLLVHQTGRVPQPADMDHPAALLAACEQAAVDLALGMAADFQATQPILHAFEDGPLYTSNGRECRAHVRAEFDGGVSMGDYQAQPARLFAPLRLAVVADCAGLRRGRELTFVLDIHPALRGFNVFGEHSVRISGPLALAFGPEGMPPALRTNGHFVQPALPAGPAQVTGEVRSALERPGACTAQPNVAPCQPYPIPVGWRELQPAAGSSCFREAGALLPVVGPELAGQTAALAWAHSEDLLAVADAQGWTHNADPAEDHLRVVEGSPPLTVLSRVELRGGAYRLDLGGGHLLVRGCRLFATLTVRGVSDAPPDRPAAEFGATAPVTFDANCVIDPPPPVPGGLPAGARLPALIIDSPKPVEVDFNLAADFVPALYPGPGPVELVVYDALGGFTTAEPGPERPGEIAGLVLAPTALVRLRGAHRHVPELSGTLAAASVELADVTVTGFEPPVGLYQTLHAGLSTPRMRVSADRELLPSEIAAILDGAEVNP